MLLVSVTDPTAPEAATPVSSAPLKLRAVTVPTAPEAETPVRARVNEAVTEPTAPFA
jgi:hypothetical protein